MDTLTTLEREALVALIHLVPEREVLTRQLGACQVLSRDSNSAGFVATLSVDRALPPAAKLTERIDGIGARIPELEGDAGFVLYVTDGYLDALEGYANLAFPNAENRWPSVEQFELYRL